MSKRTRTYRVGIIGCGRMADTIDEEKRNGPGRLPQPTSLAGAYRQVCGTELVAAADTNRERLEAFSGRWGVDHLYGDYRKMLAEEALDIVSIATHAHLHRDMTVATAKAGVKGILCEKAMAANLAEADNMIEACDRAGTILSVHYHNRWDPMMVRTRQLVADGAIGRLISVAGNMGPALVHEASHLFDLIRFFSGDEVSWVFGHLDSDVPPSDDPGGSGYMQLRGGAHAFVNATSGCPVGFELDLIGTEGRIRVGYHVDELWTLIDGVYGGRVLAGRKIPQRVEFKSGTVRAIEELIECIEHGRESSCTGHDGRAALEIALAFHVSHQQGGVRVSLPLHHTELTVQHPSYFRRQ